MLDTTHHLRFSRVDAVRTTPRGLRAELHGEQLRVDVVRDDVVRLAISRGGRFDEHPTHAVCVDPFGLSVEVAVDQDEEAARVRTRDLVVTVWLDPFRIDVHRTDGTPVVLTHQDADGVWWPYATLNDSFVVRRSCGVQDTVYGLGEKTGRQNRRGRDFTLWNTDVLNPTAAGEFTAALDPDDPRADRTSTEFDPYYVSIPFLHHHTYPDGAVAGSFLDNGYRAHYDLRPDDHYAFGADGGQYVEYVIAGPEMPDVLEAYTWLTGRSAPPPLWSLGYHQSRWHRYTQESVEALARRHREEHVPLDVVWLDIDYMDGYRVFTWDREAFPDVEGMLARLAKHGFRVITIIDPGVKRDPGYAVYDDAVARDVLCRTEGGDLYVGEVWPGATTFPDFVTPEARRWWGELNARHVRSGLAGIWNDMNEPATGVVPPQPMRFDHGRASHERYHNQYALLMAMATTDGLLEAMPDRRTFVLSRAGFAGIQRYAANWMGDNMSRWDHLWLSMPMAAGFGLSGQPFVGADVGGFMGHSEPELFARWMQYGALTPFFRNHSSAGNVDQYAWSFGEAVLDVARAAVERRYRLLPYLYACFLTASETGLPVQRPLVLHHQRDLTVREIDDEYLLGPDLLVAPVIEPGTTSRQVYLPEGRWYDWDTDEALAGGRWVVAQTPMERIPVYARGGAVVPMWPTAPATTAGYAPEVVELHLFVPDDDGVTHTSYLQEDDGISFAFRDGAFVRTTLAVCREGTTVRLGATVDGAGFAELARTRFRVHVHGASVVRATLDGADVAVEGGTLDVPRVAEPFTVELTLAG